MRNVLMNSTARFWLGGASSLAIVAAGLAAPSAALADGGHGAGTTVEVGGAGGVDGTGAQAVGKDGLFVASGSTGTGGGGGAVDLTTGSGAHGGARGIGGIGTGAGMVLGTPGATGTAGALVTTSTTFSTAITGGSGLAGQASVNNVNNTGGGGGGGVGVSASADVIIASTGSAAGGVGWGQVNTGSGGGGVGVFSSAKLTVDGGGRVTGGAGGTLNSTFAGGGGGMGVVLLSGGELVNSGVVVGGAGGNAGIVGGGGGGGGAGVLLTLGGLVTNASGGSITGGVGGTGRNASGRLTPGGLGGAGVKGADITLVNAGAITGAMGGATTGVGALPAVRAAAVQFTGGVNSLEIRAGWSFVGDVLAFSAADKLKLGGSLAASFDVGTLGGAYQDFGLFEKVGASAWTLTGATTEVTPWTVSGGVLGVGADDSLGAASGGLMFNGGVLRVTGTTFTNTTRTITWGANGGGFDIADPTNVFTVGQALAGAGGLTKSGAGELILTADNTYTGATDVDGGVLRINGDQSAATGLTTVASGATLGGSGTVGGNVVIAGGGILAPGNSPGTLTIAGDLTLSPLSVLNYEFGQSDVVGGPMNDLTKVSGDLTLDGTLNVFVTPGGVFDVGLYRVISFDGSLIDNSLTLGVTPGPVSLQLAVAGQINLINSAGATLNYWDGSNTTGDGQVEGGTGGWRASTTANWTSEIGNVNNIYTDKAFAIFAAAPGVVTINDADGAVTASGLQFASDGYRIAGDTLNLDGPAATIRVGDGTGDSVTYTATIDAEIAGLSLLLKTDLGTLILSADNTYSGGTRVSAGKLLINGDQSATPGNYQVDATGALGGSGVLGGNVMVAGGGILAPGGTSAGTLTIDGDLTLAPTSKLNYRLGQAGTVGGALNDLLIVNGDLNLNGILNVKTSAGFGPGIYRLIDYTGTLTGGLTPGDLPSGTNTIQIAIAKQVNLIHTAPAPGGGGGGGGGTTPPVEPPAVFNFWDGDGAPGADGLIGGGDGTWRATPTNWTTASGSANSAFSGGTFAIFAAQAGTVTVDGSAGPITVSGMQFASDGYRVLGDAITLQAGDNIIRVGDGTSAGQAFGATIAADLTGAGRLAKTDAGALILTGDNSYAGGTTISSGTLQLGDGGISGSIVGNVVNNAVLAFNRSDDVAFAGAFSGGGLIRQTGAGTLTLSADSSSFGGRTEVRTGTLAVDGALGGGVEVFSGARLIGTGQVGSLVSQAGGVVAPGHSIGTLTVAGDYAGGGTLEIEAVLEGDNSASDRLVVRGATSGATAVKVINQGGLGALTTNGIQVVQVDGASNGVFTLANGDYRIGAENALIVGAYAYVLRQDGGTGVTAGDWRLRSNVTALPTEPLRPADPEAPSQPGAPVTPDQPQITLYQPAVPVYEAYPRALQALNGVGTLRERTGQRQWSGAQDAGVWGRLDGGHARFEPKSSTSLANVTLDSWKVQFGVERQLSADQFGGRLLGGLTAHYGEAKADVSSPFGGGDIDTKGYGVGATLTWFGTGGGYVDAQAQASWFDSDLASDILGERAKGEGGQGYALSLEAGQVLAAGGSLTLIPQGQLTYSNTDFDSFTDRSGGQVSSDQGDSLQGRLGLALDHDWSGQDDDGKASQAKLYGLANLTYEFLDGSRVTMAGTPISSRDERLWGGLGVGGSYGWGQGRYSIYGEASAETPLASFGESYGFNGTAGFRMTF